MAHTLISRFVDHLPYYRQEPINARSGVHAPRSTLATWGGAGGAALVPLYELLRRFILGCRVLHADETPVPLLDPGAGKTKKAYVWAWARSHHDPQPGVIYQFCLGRGSQYPVAFLGGKGPPYPEPAWNGTLITDQYAAYSAVLDAKVYPQRESAVCAAHARRHFEELSRGGSLLRSLCLSPAGHIAHICGLRDGGCRQTSTCSGRDAFEYRHVAKCVPAGILRAGACRKSPMRVGQGIRRWATPAGTG